MPAKLLASPAAEGIAVTPGSFMVSPSTSKTKWRTRARARRATSDVPERCRYADRSQERAVRTREYETARDDKRSVWLRSESVQTAVGVTRRYPVHDDGVSAREPARLSATSVPPRIVSPGMLTVNSVTKVMWTVSRFVQSAGKLQGYGDCFQPNRSFLEI
jgi:hypothetical protein